mgnify:CR=1 FL=1
MKTRQYFSLIGACLILAIAPACGGNEQAEAPESEPMVDPIEVPDDIGEEEAEAPEETTADDSAETAEAPEESTETAEAPATDGSETANEPYPPEAADSFINGCVSAAVGAGATEAQASEYCACTLDEIQQEYTFEEFAEVDRQIQDGGEPPAAFDEIVNFCVEQTVGAS